MITQEDIDAMEDGMDKYEAAWLTAEGKLTEASDRIEQLERELAAEKALADRIYEEGARLQSKLAAMTAERDFALNAVIKLGDRLQRECFGLNNEGDPIGGDPPAGWKPRAEKAEARVSELDATIAKGALWQEPKAYRIRLQSDDAEEWSLLHPKDAVDYLERDGFECQPLYAAHRKARGL